METQCFNMNHRAREYYTELDEGEREKVRRVMGEQRERANKWGLGERHTRSSTARFPGWKAAKKGTETKEIQYHTKRMSNKQNVKSDAK